MKKQLRIIAVAIIAVMLIPMFVSTAIAVAPTGIKYNTVTGNIEGLSAAGSTAMEYRYAASGTPSGTWTDVKASTMAASAGTYHFRYKTAANDTTDVTTITVSAKPGAPSSDDVKYANGKITGITSSMEYNKVSATNSTWTKGTGNDVTVTVTSSTQTYYVRYAAVGNAPPSDSLVINIASAVRPDITGIKLNYDTEFFTDFGTGGGNWQYTTVGPDYSGQFLYDITADTMRAYPDMVYYFSKKGQIGGSAFATPKRGSAPSLTGVSYNAETETFKAPSTLEYITDTMDGWQPVSNGAVTIEQPAKDKLKVQLRHPPGTASFASWTVNFYIWPKLSDTAPELNNLRVENGAIYGATEDMEFTLDDPAGEYEDDEGPEWTGCKAKLKSDGSLDIKRDSTEIKVYIRLKANLTEIVTLTLPKFFPPPQVELRLTEGIITGLNPQLTYVYAVGATGSSWKEIKDALITEDKTTFVISSLLKGPALTLKIAQKPEGTAKPEDESVTKVEIGAGPAKLTLKNIPYTAEGFERGYAVVPGTVGMQYKNINDSVWSDPLAAAGSILLPVGYTAAQYQVRIAPTATAQASPITVVKVAAQQKAVAVKADYKKEIIKLKGGQSYCLDGVTWVTVPSSEKTRDLNMNTMTLYGETIQVRQIATDKKPASAITTLTLLPRIAEVPTEYDVFVDRSNTKKGPVVIMRSGSRQVEYLVSGNWKKGVPKYTDGLSATIRFAGDNCNAPSLPVTLTANGVG